MIKEYALKNTRLAALSILIAALQLSNIYAAEVTPGYNFKIPESIMTQDMIETAISTLIFFDGMPDKETSRKTFDFIDTARGVQVFLSAIPIASIEAMRLANVKMGASHQIMATW